MIELHNEVAAEFATLTQISWTHYCQLCLNDYEAHIAEEIARGALEPIED